MSQLERVERPVYDGSFARRVLDKIDEARTQALLPSSKELQQLKLEVSNLIVPFAVRQPFLTTWADVYKKLDQLAH